MKIIKSLQNSHFKKLKKLSNNKFNKKGREFIIEGLKEITLAFDSDIKIKKFISETKNRWNLIFL